MNKVRIQYGYSREVSPCMKCPPNERYEACHGSCPRYLEWAKTAKEVKKKRDEYVGRPSYHNEQLAGYLDHNIVSKNKRL